MATSRIVVTTHEVVIQAVIGRGTVIFGGKEMVHGAVLLQAADLCLSLLYLPIRLPSETRLFVYQ